MKTRLLRRALAGAVALTLVGASGALAATILTDATLSANATLPTTVQIGDNPFTIKLSAEGNLANSQSGLATVTTKYVMASNGSITPSAAPTDRVDLYFPKLQFNQDCNVVAPPQGCSKNPFQVQAVLVVPSTAAAGTSGMLTVAHTGSAGLEADSSPDVGYVVVSGPTNTAPSAPANVTASPAVSQGGLTVTWGASSDTQNDAFTYTLEAKDADDADYSQVAAGITGTSYPFAAGDPAEGTWTFRVKAVETSTNPALSSDYGLSNTAVVDRTGPNAPIGSPDRDADYGSWWKDSVTVTFTADGDPALGDGSAGSGVASVTPASQTFTANGEHIAKAKASDNAGNESNETEYRVNVDSNAPVVQFACPDTPVYFRDTAYATWTATDDGSGLAGASSGSALIDTSKVGPGAVGTSVQDNVGHTTAASTTCDVQAWTLGGFYQPVDMTPPGGLPVFNTVKGGSTVPLKFEVFAGAANELTDVSVVDSFTVTGISCPLTGVVTDDIELVTTGGTSLRYDTTGGQFIQNWQTPKKVGVCYKVTMTTDDGSSISANFKLK